jgi:hypothetical protein
MAGLGAIVVALLGGGPAALAAGPPRLLAADVTSNFQVRPASMSFGCCGQSFITGPYVSSKNFRLRKWGHIAWRRWRATGAAGNGLMWLDDCTPNCARGTFQSAPVTIQASRVRNGRYTRLVLNYSFRGRRTVERLALKLLTGASMRVYQWF